jgi:hypothetical protein
MAKKKEEVITIKKMKEAVGEFTIVGDTELHIHRLGKKLAEEFRARDANKPIKKTGPRDCQAEFMDSLYYIDAGGNEIAAPKKLSAKTRYGFPASGFKKAMVSAGRQYKNIKMTELKGRFFVLGKHVEIKGKPVLDEFWRRIGGKGPGTGTPDLGIRATFLEWRATLRIRYLVELISADSIVNLLSTAGICVGCGEDRPEKTGNTGGMWHVE